MNVVPLARRPQRQMMAQRINCVAYETYIEDLRVPDCNFRESLAKLEKSKLLIICLKFTFGELCSKILFECSGNF